MGSWSAPRATPAPGWSRWPRRSSTATSWAPGLESGGRLWPQEEADLYAYYGLPYTGASLADLDEEDAAVAQLRGLPPGR
jgi:hypothetical protein